MVLLLFLLLLILLFVINIIFIFKNIIIIWTPIFCAKILNNAALEMILRDHVILRA